jgi:nucleoside triphosphatase
MAEQVFPEPTVGVLIFNRAGEMLLVKSHKWRGKFVVPGGHIELGETAQDAVCRESKEETGLDVYDLQFLCWQQFIYDEAFWKARHFIFIDYACKTDGEQVTLNDEAQEYRWQRPETAVEAEDVDEYTHVAIRAYLRMR